MIKYEVEKAFLFNGDDNIICSKNKIITFF